MRVPGALNTTGNANIGGSLTLGGLLNATNSIANFGLLIVDGNTTVGGNLTVGYGNAQLKRILTFSGTATVNVIANSTSIIVLPVTGARPGDSVSLGFTIAPNSNLVFTPYIDSNDLVSINVRNLSGTTINFNQQIRATVIGF